MVRQLAPVEQWRNCHVPPSARSEASGGAGQRSIAPNSSGVQRLIRSPTKTLWWTFAACIAGFFVVGWLATFGTTFGLNWRPFRPDLGFQFAAAFAQLVLAGAVWAQIKTADDALNETRVTAAAQKKAADEALNEARVTAAAQMKAADEALNETRAQAARTAERHHYQRAADSLATFVAHASNASTYYGSIVVSRLQDVAAAGTDVECIERARDAIADANRGRQAAHAERFHIRARTSAGGQEVQAADRVLAVVDSQHRDANKIIAWANTLRSAPTKPPSAPPIAPRDVYANLESLRNQCLALAEQLISKAR
jgi:hypothetical protein